MRWTWWPVQSSEAIYPAATLNLNQTSSSVSWPARAVRRTDRDDREYTAAKVIRYSTEPPPSSDRHLLPARTPIVNFGYVFCVKPIKPNANPIGLARALRNLGGGV